MMPGDIRGIPEEKLDFATYELCFRLVESLVVNTQVYLSEGQLEPQSEGASLEAAAYHRVNFIYCLTTENIIQRECSVRERMANRCLAYQCLRNKEERTSGLTGESREVGEKKYLDRRSVVWNQDSSEVQFQGTSCSQHK